MASLTAPSWQGVQCKRHCLSFLLLPAAAGSAPAAVFSVPWCAVRKGSGKASDPMPALMSLPGFDTDVVKKLRKRKINSLAGGS